MSNDKTQLLRWFEYSKETLEKLHDESTHPSSVEELLRILNTFRRITEFKDDVRSDMLKNVAYLRLTSWAISGIMLPEYPESDPYKQQVLDEDPSLRWNLGLRDDFGNGYKLN